MIDKEKSDVQIIGIDNLNSYYDVKLKQDRLKLLERFENYQFIKMDITDKNSLDNLFKNEKFNIVINLAAQAGVRYSITNPYAYLDSNLLGFLNVLEACRNFPVDHLLYASSSSVYGGNSKIPYSTEDNVDHPVSLYAATKKSNELMAHSYSNLYNIPTTGLRFFTVVGPYGRPDMAYFSFTEDIFNGRDIKIFNHGNMKRDFTYVDDVVTAISRLINNPPTTDNAWNELDGKISESWAPYKIYNIGNNTPETLMRFVELLEKHIGIEANKIFMDMQLGDVMKTYADISDLEEKLNFKPETSLDESLRLFVKWYKDYYKY
ncbi:NAD-dependent epimerase/dehydratase family protein [Candidatus Enterococcus testudinis]|uniref:NAD-dependent epimerase/dehydratase family protein n=1 Tax=Candidatus Enterococcus testudinis TaxID=1834191 RepID=UPI000A3513DE|nr:NAD-dependent epimerase/dehydratase family protein [Enterococcus sp. 8G7_MSG3316]